MKINPKSPSNRLFGFPPGTYSITTWNGRLGERQNFVAFTTFEEVREYLQNLGFVIGIVLQQTLENLGETMMESRQGWVASIVYHRPRRDY